MKKYLLPVNGNFYKANLHCHSTVSDGVNTPREMKDYYKSHGYSVLAITDHEILVDHSYLNDSDFLMITGYEYAFFDGGRECLTDYASYAKTRTAEFNIYPENPHEEHHLCFSKEYVIHSKSEIVDKARWYGEENPPREFSLENMQHLIDEAKKYGYIVSLNHPSFSWMYPEFFKELKGLFAVEMFNQGSYYGYNDDNPQIYDMLVKEGMRIAVTGSDDNHKACIYDSKTDLRPWAFTVIKAPELTYKDIFNAMKNGDMYASQGPEIYDLYIEDKKAYIKCSKAKVITMHGKYRPSPSVMANENEYLECAEFEIPPTAEAIRFTVIDEYGRRAETRSYFLEDF